MIEELNETKGNLEKAELMREKYEHLKPLIKRVWDPDTKTGVTLKGIEGFTKDPEDSGINGLDLFTLFDKLCNRELTGDAAKASILLFIEKHKKYKDVILQIMEKKIRVRMGEKMILQIFPGMFTIFQVMLAEDYDYKDEKCIKRFNENLEYCSNHVPLAYLSPKIDGVRLICLITWEDDKWNINFKSRSGMEYLVFNLYIGKAIEDHFNQFEPPSWVTKKGLVIDGEWIALNNEKIEDFKLTVSLARKNEITSKEDKLVMKNSRYKMFDIMTPNEFYCIKNNPIYSVRKLRFDELCFNQSKQTLLEVLEQRPFVKKEDYKIMMKMADEMREQKKEGLMIRFNTSWEAKRTRYLMKFKFFMTEEFKVKRITIDANYKIPNERGGEDTVKAINNVIIEYKGGEVAVGSGFTTDERIKFAEDPDLIIAKVISVEFQEPFQDAKTKKWSLRCPIFKALLGDKRDF